MSPGVIPDIQLSLGLMIVDVVNDKKRYSEMMNEINFINFIFIRDKNVENTSCENT